MIGATQLGLRIRDDAYFRDFLTKRVTILGILGMQRTCMDIIPVCLHSWGPV